MATGRDQYDLAVVGGGINGAGIACDAAGRGLSVVLLEAGDLAGATSSASSKLIHGGLRYLEQRQFRLVREALHEREVLLAKAPHLVQPLRFVLPHAAASLRPRLMIRLGLFLYDHLSRRTTIPGSESLNLARDASRGPLRPDFRHGFAYWDCRVDDARLVVLNARAAADRGADIRTRTRFLDAVPDGGLWRVSIHDAETGRTGTLRARALVNAAGPWADRVLRKAGADAGRARLRLVKGSHVVVPRIGGTTDAYILQQPDRRVVFVLPFEEKFSLIGTTDVAFAGDPDSVRPDAAEIDYLLAAVNRYMAASVEIRDIVWSFAGVRPLFDDAAASEAEITRDYRLVRGGEGLPPLVSVIGGKITTYRRLAEEVLSLLAPSFPKMDPPWTADAPLPGGDLPAENFATFLAELGRRYAGLDPGFLSRLARRHGSRLPAMLGDARDIADLGTHFGAGLYEREVVWMRDTEWARHPDDILWRRTLAGLHMTGAQRDRAREAIARLL